MKILGIDPGSTNFAMVLLNTRGNVVFARMMQRTIRSMADTKKGQRASHREMMRRYLSVLAPTDVMVEQFAARRFGTHTCELVNLMIGGIMMICDALGINEHVTMASTWKNALKRVASLDDLYAEARERGTPAHVVDATCLAMFLFNGRTFTASGIGALRANVARAGRLLPVNQRVQPKRKGKNELPVRKGGRGRKVRNSRVLDVEPKGAGIVHGSGHGKHPPD